MSRRNFDDSLPGSPAASSLIASQAPRLQVTRSRSHDTPAVTDEAWLDLRAHSMALEMQNQELRESYRGLERARLLYFELFDSAPLPYFLFDQRHHLQELNLAGGELLGGDRVRLKHRPFFPHLIDTDRPAFHQHLGTVFRDRARSEVQLTVVDAMAAQHRIRFVSQIVPAAPGEESLCMSVAMPLVTTVDRGPRVSADLVWWPRHLEEAGVFSLVTSLDLGCLFIADGLCEALGFKPSELLSKDWNALTEFDAQGDERALMDQLRSGSRDAFTLSKRIRKAAQGSLVVRETVSAIRARGGRIHACLHTVCLEDEATPAALPSAARAHNADVEVENWLLVCVEGRASRWAASVASRTIQIPEDVLARWSQLELGDLNRLVLETCSELARTTPIRVVPTLPDSVSLVRHCGWQMRRLIRNVLSNALEASSDSAKGKDVLVSTRQCWMEAELLDPAGMGQAMPAGDYVVLEIQDQGVGMTPQSLAKAFEPFYTTKAGRAGLGLAAARSVVERHQGFIRLSTHVDTGTTAQIFLPMSPTVQRETARPHPSELHTPISTMVLNKILLVDDEAGVRSVVARMVETLGYEVEEVASGAEALSRFKRSPFSYRVVLSDLNMPGMDGLTLSHELRQLRPDCACVLMTGFYDAGDWGPLPNGMDAPLFLQKPFTLDHLQEALAREASPASFPSMHSPSAGDLRSQPLL